MQKFKRVVSLFLARIPQDLPRTKVELEAFSKSIVDLYGLPDNSSYERMIATMIQHLPNNSGRISKHTFFKSIKRAEAMETAYWKLRELNDKIKQEATKTEEPLLDDPSTAQSTA